MFCTWNLTLTYDSLLQCVFHFLLQYSPWCFWALAIYIDSEQRREALSPHCNVGGGEPEGCGVERWGVGRILGPCWGLRSLNIHAEEERSTLPNYRLHHTTSSWFWNHAICFMFFPHLPLFYCCLTQTHTVYNLWRVTYTQMHTHWRTLYFSQNPYTHDVLSGPSFLINS